MSEINKNHNPDVKASKKVLVSNITNRFIKSNKSDLFDFDHITDDLLQEFCRDEDVQFYTHDYIVNLCKLWKKKHPDRIEFLKLIKGASRINSKQPKVLEDIESPNLENISNKKVENNMNDNFDEARSSEFEKTKTEKPSDNLLGTGLKPGQTPTTHGSSSFKPVSAPYFNLPNCMVGIDYKAKIDGKHSSGKEIIILDIKIPESLGLIFVEATQELSGSPLVDGEFNLDLQWCFKDEKEKQSGICKLISNPDPKSLWKVLETDSSLPYQKSNQESKFMQCENYNLLAASRRGRSHEHVGSFRDDDFYINHDDKTGWTILMVADGAGSAKYSREGSKIAVTESGDFLTQYLSSNKSDELSALIDLWDKDSGAKNKIFNLFYYSFHEMAVKAVKAIETETKNTNSNFKDYSTTLLVSAVKRKGDQTFLATFWMGDGAIAAYGPTGTLKLMGSPDSGEFAGQTRFLDSNALNDKEYSKRVGIGYFKDVTSIILMTDGVSDPYFETDMDLANPTKWDALWSEILPILQSENPSENLVDWLHFFKQGHHDDRTIAILY